MKNQNYWTSVQMSRSEGQVLAYLLGLLLAKAAAPTALLGVMPTATAQLGLLHMEIQAALLTVTVLGQLQTMAPALLAGVLQVPPALLAEVLQRAGDHEVFQIYLFLSQYPDACGGVCRGRLITAPRCFVWVNLLTIASGS